MTDVPTHMDKRRAREALGITSGSGVVPIDDRDREALIDSLRLCIEQKQDLRAAHDAAMQAMEKRLKTARKAKRFANRRADKAEREQPSVKEAARVLLDCGYQPRLVRDAMEPHLHPTIKACDLFDAALRALSEEK